MGVSIIYGIIVFVATTIGAIAGLDSGVIIKPTFDMIELHNANTISLYSSCAVFFMAFISILKFYRQKIKIKRNIIFPISFGSILGGISIFLGIGGGQLNIALLTIFFSYEIKEAAIYSVATIFFSQCSKLIGVFYKNEFLNFDLSPLPIICIFAIVGGHLGAKLNMKFTNKKSI